MVLQRIQTANTTQLLSRDVLYILRSPAGIGQVRYMQRTNNGHAKRTSESEKHFKVF